MPYRLRTLHCRVVTPDGIALDAQAESAMLPAHDGLVGIWPGHAPFVCLLGIGLMRVRLPEAPGSDTLIFVNAGFAHVPSAVIAFGFIAAYRAVGLVVHFANAVSVACVGVVAFAPGVAAGLAWA